MANSEKNDKTLTVVIPVHRMAGHLQEIQRLVSANVNFKIIVVHDEGDLETGVQLREILKSIKPEAVTLIEGKFGSPGAARNAGLQVAHSTWVAFWDCDDEAFFEVYEDFQKSAKSNYEDSDLIIFDYTIEILGKGTSRNIKSDQNIKKVILNPGIWRIIFRRSSIDLIKFPNISMAEDQVFLLRILNRNTKISYSNQIAYKYRVGVPNQLTSRSDKLVEIETAMDLETQILKTAFSNEVRDLGLIMLSRQIATCLVRGDVKLKLSALRRFSSLTFSTKFLLPLIALAQLFFWFKNKLISNPGDLDKL